MRDLFFRFAKLFLDHGEGPMSEDELDSRVDAVVALFQALSQPGSGTVQGLWVELAVIVTSSDPVIAIASWHSSPRNLHDFSSGPFRFEVKSSSQELREHRFLLEQLSEQPSGRTLVCSLLVEEDVNGVSVGELVAMLRKRLANEEESQRRLETVVTKTLGKNWFDSDAIRFNLEAALESVRLYDARDVPTVLQPLPSEVKRVEFVVDLSSVEAMSLASARSIAPYFARLLPEGK